MPVFTRPRPKSQMFKTCTSFPCLPAVIVSVLTLASPFAHAQSLQLGTSTPARSGSVTISSAGTTAAGDYQFYDTLGNPAPVDPGTTRYQGITAYHASTVNVQGGSVSQLYFNGDGLTNGTLNVSGGILEEVLFLGLGNGDAHVSGGTITQLDFQGPDEANSHVTVSGGSITSLDTSGQVQITDGSIGELYTIGGIADLSGGSFGKITIQGLTQVNITGGTIGALLAYPDGGTFDLFGTGFAVTPEKGNHGFYQVTGLLQNGDPLSAEYENLGGHLQFNSADVPLQAVPEASTTISFGLLLGLGGLGTVSRRKKSRSA